MSPRSRPHKHRETPRPRHPIGPRTLFVLRPFFRYSRVRDAYVLRGIGSRHGPVLRLVAKPARPHRPAHP
jgi:hypothetical protein